MTCGSGPYLKRIVYDFSAAVPLILATSERRDARSSLISTEPADVALTNSVNSLRSA